ncbi:MAG: nucleotidyl transferase AbiEii/AbiGii toxin family protein [Bacillota bacterium]|nr:nucleotidyl transferase AbiEii/AbiGii toxin family protein [Bacillota bacterium]
MAGLLEKLAGSTSDVLRQLRDARLLEAYYLTGGTAQAVQLDHRISLDLDLFTREPVRTIPAARVQDRCIRLFGEAAVRTVLREPDQIWIEIRGIQVRFLAFPYPHRYPFLEPDGVAVADVRDIALQKALAIGRRAVARDYIDLAWILRSGRMSLEELVREAQEAFRLDGEQAFSPRLFFQQLLYTADLEDKEAAVATLRERTSFEELEKIPPKWTGPAGTAGGAALRPTGGAAGGPSALLPDRLLFPPPSTREALFLFAASVAAFWAAERERWTWAAPGCGRRRR